MKKSTKSLFLLRVIPFFLGFVYLSSGLAVQKATPPLTGANVSEYICGPASRESLIPNFPPKAVRINDDIVPILPLNSLISHAVSVTTLASALISGFGDSVGIIIMGSRSDENIQWEIVSENGTVTKLPFVPFLSKAFIEIQYNNFYDLYHTDIQFDGNFPIGFVLLGPTDRLRFSFPHNNISAVADCESHSIWFTFVPLTPTFKAYLEGKGSAQKEPISIKSCDAWPFAEKVFRVCPVFEVITNPDVSGPPEPEPEYFDFSGIVGTIPTVPPHPQNTVTPSGAGSNMTDDSATSSDAATSTTMKEESFLSDASSSTENSWMSPSIPVIGKIVRTTFEPESPTGTNKFGIRETTMGYSIHDRTEISSRSLPETSLATTTKSWNSPCTNDSGLCQYCIKDPSTKQCVLSVYPQVFDIDAKEAKITITVDSTKDLEEIGKADCTLLNKDNQEIETEVKTDGKKITVEFGFESSASAEMRLSCSINGNEFLSNKIIYISSFQTLVEHKTPFSSGFDTSVEYKTVYITFKEAFPSQFTAAATGKTNDTFCVLDEKSGPRFSAKLETPSVMSCNINGSGLAVGSHKLYAIRRPELENATFEYQSPLTFTVSTPSTASPNTKTAVFLPTLKGIVVTFGSTTDIQNRTFNCSKVFMSSEAFGSSSTCRMTGDVLSITLGSAPTILPYQPLLIRSGALTNAYLDGGQPNVTQYDVIELKVPEDVVTPAISIPEPSTAIACQENVNLSAAVASGDGGRALTFKWQLKNGGSSSLANTLSQATSSFVQIPLSDMGKSASVSVEACNFANKCSESNAVEIKASTKTFQFTVAIAGIPLNPLPSAKIALSAIPNFATCDSNKDLSIANISYEWTLDGKVVSKDSVFMVPARLYAPNSNVIVGISAKYWDAESSTMLEAIAKQTIAYGNEGLVAIVDGIDRAVASDTDVIIDGRQSYDPNTGSTNLNHSWDCKDGSGKNCTNLGDVNTKVKLFIVPAGTLKPKEKYENFGTLRRAPASHTHSHSKKSHSKSDSNSQNPESKKKHKSIPLTPLKETVIILF